MQGRTMAHHQLHSRTPEISKMYCDQAGIDTERVFLSQLESSLVTIFLQTISATP